VAAAAAAAAGLPTDVATARRLLVIALLAAGMGLRSATVRRLGVPEVTTTVVRSTVTALAADSAALGAGFPPRLWQLATIAIRLVGAVAGALLVRVSLFVPFLLVASLLAVAAGAYHAPVIVRGRPRSRSAGPPARGS
jgi:Protein of unknown function (DUF1275)